jgi:hypothetical protein
MKSTRVNIYTDRAQTKRNAITSEQFVAFCRAEANRARRPQRGARRRHAGQRRIARTSAAPRSRGSSIKKIADEEVKVPAGQAHQRACVLVPADDGLPRSPLCRYLCRAYAASHPAAPPATSPRAAASRAAAPTPSRSASRGCGLCGIEAPQLLSPKLVFGVLDRYKTAFQRDADQQHSNNGEDDLGNRHVSLHRCGDANEDGSSPGRSDYAIPPRKVPGASLARRIYVAKRDWRKRDPALCLSGNNRRTGAMRDQRGKVCIFRRAPNRKIESQIPGLGCRARRGHGGAHQRVGHCQWIVYLDELTKRDNVGTLFSLTYRSPREVLVGFDILDCRLSCRHHPLSRIARDACQILHAARSRSSQTLEMTKLALSPAIPAGRSNHRFGRRVGADAGRSP